MILVYFHLCWELKSSIALTLCFKNCLISLYIYCFLWYKSTLHIICQMDHPKNTWNYTSVLLWALRCVYTITRVKSKLSEPSCHCAGTHVLLSFPTCHLISGGRRLNTMSLCNQCRFFNSHLSSWSHSLPHLLPGLHLLNKLWHFPHSLSVYLFLSNLFFYAFAIPGGRP